ncbi:MAG: gliding motility protein GldD [Parabacteroides sp.]
MKRGLVVIGLCSLWGIACTPDYTPKPRGYMRIEPPQASYVQLAADSLPFSFDRSQETILSFLPSPVHEEWFNLDYPALQATLYCSCFPVTPRTLSRAVAESRHLVEQQLKANVRIREKIYIDPDQRVFASLFLLDGETSSPIQFLLTDSTSRFFRGALYYDCAPAADSLAPVTDYLLQDILALIQSFRWTSNR